MNLSGVGLRETLTALIPVTPTLRHQAGKELPTVDEFSTYPQLSPTAGFTRRSAVSQATSSESLGLAYRSE
jgi:hypothetical protein